MKRKGLDDWLFQIFETIQQIEASLRLGIIQNNKSQLSLPASSLSSTSIAQQESIENKFCQETRLG